MDEKQKKQVETAYAELKATMKKSPGQYDEELIERAYQRALEAHGSQVRFSGQPYLIHPIAVALTLAEMGMDAEAVAAALLHDVVEDTDVTLQDITREFNADIAALVDGVTKLGKVSLATKEEEQAENVRKMLLAMSEDIRVIIIKLADRLHNMRTLRHMKDSKQREKSLETLEIYAPIAHRLGIRAIKEELEDLAISYLDPVAYQEIADSLKMQEKQRQDFLEEIQNRIGERIQNVVSDAKIEGRIKSVHGIYRKMYMQNRNFDEIYDIYAVRVIVDSVIDCYNILGVIHDMFRPIPGRFKDYISTPKANMYQSLHTTVIGKEGIPFEVQIRTWDMHHTAEYGIAAHWKYKVGVKGKAKFEERLSWIRQLLESQNDSQDAQELVRTIKSDLAPEEVFVFTPKGDVKSLPMGATVIDFAYAIHSAVGNRMVGAKVDGRIVPIDYKVQTGEIVEILTTSQQGKGPSRDWLKIVKTNEARSKIRSWFKKERRDENIAEGKAELEREFRRNKIHLPEEHQESFLQKLAERQRCNSIEDFYAAIGYGGIIISRVMPYIREEYNKIKNEGKEQEVKLTAEKERVGGEGVIVEGLENCLIKLSKCCNPLPGEDIIGFITRGHGVSIHKQDCNNVPKDMGKASEPERWVEAHWGRTVKEDFKATLSIFTRYRNAMLADVTVQLANMHVMLHNVIARELKDGGLVITITITVNGREHLNGVVQKLKTLEGVERVVRTGL